MASTLQSGLASKTAPVSSDRRTAILKALADPRRFEVLERIAGSGCALTCSQTLADLPISAATLSHHIKELETAGLIRIERKGKYHFLSVEPGALEAVAATLQSLAAACPNAVLNGEK
jgi:ArsR family transcriptional regulator, arsenate/arsenite/antimonite-responsive transcriptional repressor